MKRFSRRTASLLATAAVLTFSAVPPAVAHDSGSGSYSTTYADTMEHKADYLRVKADKLESSLVLNDDQADLLQNRLRTAANKLDALAAEYRSAASDEERYDVKQRFEAAWSAIQPTLMRAGLAFKGDAARRYATSLANKASYYQRQLNGYVDDGRIRSEDATAIRAALSAVRTKVAQSRSLLTPDVLGTRIINDPSAAAGVLRSVGSRLSRAAFWVKTAGSAIYATKV